MPIQVTYIYTLHVFSSEFLLELKWKVSIYGFLLHVLNHALERFLIEVLIDLTNYGIHFYLITVSLHL